MLEPECKLLLVGKPGALRNALSSLLTAMGLAHLHTADGGLLALKIVRELDPALVVVDGGLPDAEALELIQQIKQERPTVRILALADRDQQSQRLLAAGADKVLATGTPFNQLSAALQQLLRDVSSKKPRQTGMR